MLQLKRPPDNKAAFLFVHPLGRKNFEARIFYKPGAGNHYPEGKGICCAMDKTLSNLRK